MIEGLGDVWDAIADAHNNTTEGQPDVLTLPTVTQPLPLPQPQPTIKYIEPPNTTFLWIPAWSIAFITYLSFQQSYETRPRPTSKAT